MAGPRKYPPVMERIAARTVMDGDCHVYVGSSSRKSGHRLITPNGEKHGRLVHRVVWQHHHQREIPEGMVIRHTCDNPPCVNPAHLLLGTVADNNRDRDQRGRHRALKGSNNGMAKLTEPDIPLIRKAIADGEPQHRIGERFGVSQSLIHLVSSGKAWKHVAADVLNIHNEGERP